ncbi:hypothetical protein MNEG_12440 [Monoraphidium neglectum]|uniref:Uncharacterized protein n=1 Tax=Monoraphidium neglectum TaxID=145388 RepID=A0A0D2J6T8_9CHLO|nr:hypothetical protein MNEG_12440 [Monoraphidium neglectum]KIY95522.1 hypothetical protein MNEG_12440 [Monoraphidium neglectum]|eukprot:XP_013894542.1 hypothetical protein MNEG_12440 [Monoraphidium neglectum]
MLLNGSLGLRSSPGPFVSVQRAHRVRPVARAEGGGDSGAKGGTALSEDMIARLRAAEEEAARLKKQLSDLQQAQQAGGAPAQPRDPVLDGAPKRIDGTDKRETLFSGPSKRNSWLSEEDVDWITGGGPSEASASSGPTEEQQSLIGRRLAIGAVATAGLVAFSLVPTKDLRLKPAKPLYFYLTALLRVQEQLVQCKDLVEDADWTTLRLILPRITGPPGDAKASLFDAIALLNDRAVAAKAEEVAGDFLESVANIDSPRRYYDAMPSRQISGSQNAEFVRFSSGALVRAQSKLTEFLALMPRDAVAAAKQAVAAELAGAGVE